MNKGILRKKSVLTFLASILFGAIALQSAKAVDNYNVLPTSGRNKLFHTYLMGELDTLVQERKAAVAEALTSVEKLQDRQLMLRSTYKELLGEMPAKTPLNPVITGTVDGEGFTIEKLHFESVPNHHVTANFYIPDGDGPFPTILVTCGHYPVAKSIDLYQHLCRLLATNGFAALIVDPIAQAERYQVVNPSTGFLNFKGGSGTSGCSYMDVGAVIAGTSVTAYELWDNVRSIDYLYTRTDVVDTTKIGNTGSSGGGAQATYLIGYDERIKVSAINSFIMNEQTLYSTIGPQTGSQNLSYEGEYGIDHTEYIAMFAPKPLMILAATQDFFDVTATQATYAESQLVYEKLGVPEKIGYFEYNDTHGYSKPKREVAVKWFRTWFYGDTTSIVEPEWEALPEDSLIVTETGQVYTSFENELMVTELNQQRADDYTAQRENFWATQSKDSALNMVKSLIKHESYLMPSAEITDSIVRDTYTIKKMAITSGDEIPVTGLLIKKNGATGKLPAVLYVNGKGKKSEARSGNVLEYAYVDSNMLVLAIDVRGFGETADLLSLNEDKHGNKEHRNSVISLYMGKTLIGQRVADIQKALDVLLARDDVDATDVKIVSVDRAHTAVLHAAAIDSRITEVEIREENFKSWNEVISNPTEKHNMTHQVPFAMEYYDLPDLIAAIAPRSVLYTEKPEKPSSVTAPKVSSVGISVFPNPSVDVVEVNFSLSVGGVAEIKIYDLAGRLIETKYFGNLAVGDHKQKIELSDLFTGTYLLSLSLDGKEITTTKLVVKGL